MGSISVKQNSISLFPSILEDTNALFQYSARNGKKYKNEKWNANFFSVP